LVRLFWHAPVKLDKGKQEKPRKKSKKKKQKKGKKKKRKEKNHGENTRKFYAPTRLDCLV